MYSMLQQHQVLLREMCFLLFQMDLRLLLISILLGAFYDSYAQKGTFLNHISFLLITMTFQIQICHTFAFLLQTSTTVCKCPASAAFFLIP